MNVTSTPPMPNLRTSVIVVTVVSLHAGGLWALQSGLLHRLAAEVVVPAEVLIDMSPTDSEPAPTKPQPAAALPSPPTPAPGALSPAPAPQVALAPLAVPATPTEPEPSAQSPAPVAAPASTANTASAANTSGGSNASLPSSSATAAHRAPALELPSSDADYLNNPRPVYPALSKRQAEQGKVVIRTFIGIDGVAQQAQIKQSSGFDRLDQAALATALKWRYVPGKRAGVAEAMWFDVPFNWVLR
jgi:protein TonB